MSRARKPAFTFGALVLAMMAFATTVRAETVYDVQDLGPGDPIEINSIGAVLLKSASGLTYEVVGPTGTRSSMSLPAGWDGFSLEGITDPLPSAALGVAWGVVTRGDERCPVVWNPLGAVTVLSGVSPIGAHRVVDSDGWMYGTVAAEEPGHIHVLAWQPDHPEVRVDAPGVAGHPNLTSAVSLTGGNSPFQPTRFEETQGVMLVALDETGSSASAKTALWNAASGTFAELGVDVGISAMNRAGETIGADGAGRAFWSATGARTSFPDSLAGYDPYLLSNGGHVVLYRWTGVLETAAVWNAHTGEVHDLTADLEGAHGRSICPLAVAEDGTVVGDMLMADDFETGGGSHAILWNAQLGLVDLTPTELELGGIGGGSIAAVSRQGRIFFVKQDLGDTSGTWRVFSWQLVDGIQQVSRVGLDITCTFELSSGSFGGPYAPRLTSDLGQYLSVDLTGHVALATPRGVTQAGTNVEVQPDASTAITFAGIVTPGETSVVAYAIDDPMPPSVPADFALSGTGALINISTTAAFTGSVELAIHYDQGSMPEDGSRERQIRLLHFVDPTWVDVTDYTRSGGFLDRTNNIVYGKVTSFSPFAIVEILDSTPPVIAAKDDVHADATSTLGATVTFTAPTATDDTVGSVAVTCVPASGTVFPVGVTTVTCTASDTHQNTATSTFDVIVQIDPRYLKGAVADSLNTLIATSDKKTVKRLLKAIRAIEDSLDPALWVDDFHLTKKGREVFQEESEASTQLLAIESPPGIVTQALRSLVEADLVLAATALAEATAANPTSTHLAPAAAEMDLAAASSASAAYGDAIRHYRSAWKSSMRALGLL